MLEKLIVVNPDATIHFVATGYQALRSVFPESGFDHVHNNMIGCFVDDEGILKGLPLNVVGSMFMGRCLFGPVVFCAPEPDEEGNTLPLAQEGVEAIRGAASRWRDVLSDAEYTGQDISVHANEGTLPPAQIYELPDDWRPGDPIPGYEGPVYRDEAGEPL